MNVLSVLIVADDPLARAGLAALLAGEVSIAVAGQSGSDADLGAVLDAFLPDAVVWDLGWEAAGRTAALGEFTEQYETPVVALLASEVVAGEVRAAGARGLLARTSDGAQIAAAVQAVVHGLLVFDDALLPAAAPAGDVELVEPLSGRELDVLRHLAEGLSNKEIARALDISEHTVKFHVNAILGKLGAQSRTEAVVRATRAGLILL